MAFKLQIEAHGMYPNSTHTLNSAADKAYNHQWACYGLKCATPPKFRYWNPNLTMVAQDLILFGG